MNGKQKAISIFVAFLILFAAVNFNIENNVTADDPPENPIGGDVPLSYNWTLDSRDMFWNKYKRPILEDPNRFEYRLEASEAPLNYQNSSDVWTPINTTVTSKDLTISGRDYIYGVDTGVYESYFREQSSDTKDRPMAMSQDDYILTFSPTNFIKFEPHKYTTQGRVGNRQQSFAIVNENEVIYPEQYKQIGSSDSFADLTYNYNPIAVKENLVIEDIEYMRGRFDSQCNPDNYNDVNLVFENIIRAYFLDDEDWQTLGVIYGGDMMSFKEFGMETDDEITTTEEIFFTDINGDVIYYIPQIYAHDMHYDNINGTLYENFSHILLNKTLSMTSFGNLRVDILTPWWWLDNESRTYPIYIDPTVNYVVGQSSDDCHETTDGAVYSDTATVQYIGSYTKQYNSSFRFQDVNVPRNSTINSAYMQYHGKRYGAMTAPAIWHHYEIHCIDEDNTTTFDTTDRPSSRALTENKTDWDFKGLSTDMSYANRNTPDISDAVEEVINRYNPLTDAGWNDTGNALAVVICDDLSGWRVGIHSYDYNGGSNPAVLYITYIPPWNIPPVAPHHPGPANNTYPVDKTPTLNITVYDENEDDLTVKWYSNSSGSWVCFETDNNVPGDGSVSPTAIATNFATPYTDYWWNVSVTDSQDYNHSEIFHLKTGSYSQHTLSPDDEDYNETSPVSLNVTLVTPSGLDSDIYWYSYNTTGAGSVLLDTQYDLGNGTHTYQWNCGSGTKRWYVYIDTGNFTNTSVTNSFYCDDAWSDDFWDDDYVEDYTHLFDYNSWINLSGVYNNTVVDGLGTKVMIDFDFVEHAQIGRGGTPSVVWINDTIGYVFYIELYGTESVAYRKTTDNGASWGSEVTVYGPSSRNPVGVSVWYDRWTLGMNGTKIYITFCETDNDYLYFTHLDTSDDSLGDIVYIADVSSIIVQAPSASICRSQEGRLWIASPGSVPYIGYSDDEGATWTNSEPTSWDAGVMDNMQIFPLPNEDVMLVDHVSQANLLNYSVYTDSTETWSAITSLATSENNAGRMSASYNIQTNEIYCAFINRTIYNDSNIKLLKYNATTQAWSISTIFTGLYVIDMALSVSQGNGDIYFTITNSSVGDVALVDVYSTNSTDNGTTWSTWMDVDQTATGQHAAISSTLMSYYNMYIIWSTTRGGSIDDLYGISLRDYNISGYWSDVLSVNLTSVNITLPSGHYWSTFDVDAPDLSNMTFSILNGTDDSIIIPGLSGDNNDISSLSPTSNENRTIKLFAEFNGTINLDKWSISWTALETSVDTITPYATSTNPLNITASGPQDLDNITLYYRYSSDNTTWSTYTGYQVQRGRNSFASGEIHMNVTVNEVDTDHAFVLAYPYMRQEDNTPGANAGDADYMSVAVWLHNSTTVRFKREASDDDVNVDWQLIECFDDEFSVQRGMKTFTGSTATTITDTIISVTPANTMAWHTMNTTGITNDLGTAMQFTSNVTDATTMTFTRKTGTAITGAFRWVAVEWDTNKIDSFQIYDIAEVDTETDGSPYLHTLDTAIDVSDSILLFQQRAIDDGGLDSSATAGYIKDEDEVGFYKHSTTNGAAIHLYVIDFGSGCGNKYVDIHEAEGTTWGGETYSIGGTVDTDRALTFVSITQDGDGDAKPRHTVVSNLISSTELSVYHNYTGNNGEVSWQVLELPYHNDSGWSSWINGSNPDTVYPWSWDFDFPNGTGYYEFYSIGNTTTDMESPPPDADARCYFFSVSAVTIRILGNTHILGGHIGGE